jgi:hypothetical protein
MVISGRAPVILGLLGVLGALLLGSASASGASLVAKDGKIHACYKAKGKGKGTLRVVRSAKVRCPKKWKKTSWYAAGQPGPRGETGPAGATGAPGDRGLPGTAGNVVVEELEDKVSELLTRIEGLEDLIPTVQSLCTQAETLTTQVNAVESAVEGLGLNAVLTTLGGVLEIPTLPGALPSFSCPN